MRTTVLLSCASKKRLQKCKARDLYDSPLFKLSLKYAEKFDSGNIFILSALHGLVKLDEFIEPYNVTLNRLSKLDRKEWATKVLQQLMDSGFDLDADKFIFLAGANYRKYLIPHIQHYEIPMEGLRIGQQLAYLKRRVSGE